MKKQYAILFIVLLSFSVFYSSCNDKTNNGNTGTLRFDSVQINVTEHLFGDVSKPSCNLVVNYAYPKKSSDSQLKDSLNRMLISEFFGKDYMEEEDLDYILKDYAETYTKDYRKDLEPMYFEDQRNAEDKKTVESWYSYYRKIDSHIQFYEGNLLTYRINLNEYTGGAYNECRSFFMNIDLASTHALTLSDLFTEGYEEALTELLWEQLMANNNVSSREELEDMGYGLTNDLTPAENFYLDHEGITFYYNINEFTPYLMGPTEIKLSYSKIAGMLKDNTITTQLRQ